MANLEPIEYISLGGGPPSVALLILNLTKRIPNPTNVVVFADTGWEKSVTYKTVEQVAAWAAEFDAEFIRTEAAFGPLQNYVRDKSVPIPVHTMNGLGKRQCTDRWKIEPVRKAVAARYGKGRPQVAQLGMTVDEILRVKPPRVKRDRNRYPLIDLGLKRIDCEDIIREAGLPIPEWSACIGCPLQSKHRWQRVASEWPEEYMEAVALDDFLRERAERDGKDPIWLHYSKRPLRNVLAPGQATMLRGAELEIDPADEGCPDGMCFT